MIPLLTDSQAADLARRLKPQIDEYINEHWSAFMQYLEEEAAHGDIHAIRELEQINQKAVAV